MGYSKVNLNEIEPTGPGGMVRFVRRELDLQAFGINWFQLPPNVEASITTSGRAARMRST
jgi:hypothetical protein